MAYDPSTDTWSDGLPALAASHLTAAFGKRVTANGGDASATSILAAVRPRTAAQRAQDFLGPKDYLLTSVAFETLLNHNAMDAAPYLQAMANGGSAPIPDGLYRCDTPMVLQTGAALKALHQGNVTLSITFAAGDVITVPAGVNNVRIEALRFTTTVTRTSGAVIHVSGASNTLIVDVRSEAGPTFLDFLVIDGGAAVTTLERFYLQAISGDAIRLAGYAIDTYIRTGNVTQAGNGLHLRSASGIYVNDFDIVACTGNGVLVDPSQSANDNVNALRAHNVLCDTNTSDGWAFIGTGPISDIDLDFCWGSSNGTTGVFTPSQAITLANSGINLNNPLTNGVKISGFHGHSNGGNCISILQGSNITVDDGTVCSNNSQAAAHTYNGVFIGPLANLVSVVGIRSGLIGSQALFGGAVKQSIGLYRVSGAGGKVITVIGCQFPGNYTAGYSIQSASGDLITDVGNVSV